MNKNLPILILAVTITLILSLTAICVCFIPNFAAYLDAFLSVSGSPIENVRTIVYIGGVILALPCLVILMMALHLPSAAANDRIFTPDTAALLSRIALILCIDCVLFLATILALLIVGELMVSPLMALIDLIGFALAFLLRVLAGYVRRAAEMQEEVDSTL